MLPILAAALTPLLTTLAENGLSLLAGAISAKGKDLIEDKLGVKLDTEVTTEDGRLKLLQLQSSHEEFLLDIVIKQKDQELRELELRAQDINSARNMNTKVNASVHASWLTKNIPAILAITVIGVGFLLLAYSKEPDIRTAVVGLMTLVLGFYFGSTSSSKAKDDSIRALSNEVGK